MSNANAKATVAQNEQNDMPDRRVNFNTTDELHTAVRLLAVRRRTSVKALWVQAMLDFLEREMGRN